VKFDLDAMDLESLIEAIDRSGISEFSLTTADGEVRISKSPADGARPVAVVQQQAAPASTPAAPAAQAAPAAEVAAAPITAVDPVDGAAAPGGTGSDHLEVRTPLLGIFYRTPQPGAPPFVEVGDRVEPDTTVAIIEAMKVFTAVAAGVSGVITEVLASDRKLVEFDQVLFRVAPDAAPIAQ
jgi:acetyl-CoA carboxylase biotin carboxyl carrier protein